MRLKWLELEHFRNYESLKLDFSKNNVIALIGPNAQGKTNLLEGIAFLALGKSFRARKSLEVLQWERPHGRIKGAIVTKDKETELEVFIQRSPEQKKVKKHNKVTKPSEFLGSLCVVLFTPEHLLLVSGSPKLRRQYMDRILVQIDKSYVTSFSHYQQILRQRNALLKSIQLGRANSWELELWDASLVSEAAKIWKARQSFIDFLNQEITKHYQDIAESKEKLKIQYETHAENYEERLIAHRDSDIRFGATSVGPHRDDFSLILDENQLAETGSRGECRSAVLSLKIAEIHYIEKVKKQKPLLLLDDLFSELDESRQKQLGKLLKDHQCIITTTSRDHVKGLQKVKVYEVKKGNLSEV